MRHDDKFVIGPREFRFSKTKLDASAVAKMALAPANADDDTTELPQGLPFAVVSKCRQSLGVSLAVSSFYAPRVYLLGHLRACVPSCLF